MLINSGVVWTLLELPWESSVWSVFSSVLFQSERQVVPSSKSSGFSKYFSGTFIILIAFRLWLINCNFGLVLDFFLSKMGEMMQSSSYEFSDLDRMYFVKTRGKLTVNKVSVFSGFVLYDKIILYLVNLVLIKAPQACGNFSDPAPS